MTFEVASALYDRFMGRYSTLLAPRFADFAGVRAGEVHRALDVGSGPGALTAELVARLGADAVAAADPSGPFAEAVRERQPGVDVRVAGAEELPFPADAFDATLAQLVIPFVPDPVAGLAKMGRVTRPGGVVAACAWDHGNARSPLAPFWRAAAELDPSRRDESGQPGTRAGALAELLRAAGLADVEDAALDVTLHHPTFEDWWEPFTFGVGPAGAYVASLGEDARAALRERCRELLPPAPFDLTSCAWAARGRA